VNFSANSAWKSDRRDRAVEFSARLLKKSPPRRRRLKPNKQARHFCQRSKRLPSARRKMG